MGMESCKHLPPLAHNAGTTGLPARMVLLETGAHGSPTATRVARRRSLTSTASHRCRTRLPRCRMATPQHPLRLMERVWRACTPPPTHPTPRRPIACLVDLPPPPPPSPPAASRRACHWIEPWFIPAMCAPPGRQSNRKLQDQLEQVACTQHIDVVEECGQQRTGQATSNRCVRTWVANAAEEQLGHDRQGFEASHRAKIQSTQSSQEFELVCKRILEICLFRVVWVRVLVKRRYTQSMDKRNRPP